MGDTQLLIIGVAVAGAAAALVLGWSLRRREASRTPNGTLALRAKFFTLTPSDIGTDYPSDHSGVWGAAMEIGVQHGAALLVSFVTGDASIYFSSGGGVIGGIGHEAVRAAATHFVQLVGENASQLSPGEAESHPPNQRVRFYALARHGPLRSAELPETELSSGMHSLSECFHAGHDVITQLRLNCPAA